MKATAMKKQEPYKGLRPYEEEDENQPEDPNYEQPVQVAQLESHTLFLCGFLRQEKNKKVKFLYLAAEKYSLSGGRTPSIYGKI